MFIACRTHDPAVRWLRLRIGAWRRLSLGGDAEVRQTALMCASVRRMSAGGYWDLWVVVKAYYD